MANIWREPIFDRTYRDVAFALQKIAEWKEHHTHAADVVATTDALKIQSNGDAYVDNDTHVMEADGAVRVVDGALVVDIGTVYDLKGCLNLSDIVRIEDNITYLSKRLTQYGYPIMTYTKEWTKNGLPAAQDMTRIGDNIRALFSGFATPPESVDIPSAMLSYEDINALENNLYLLKQLLDAMEGSFIKSGTYTSGATRRLPLRR